MIKRGNTEDAEKLHRIGCSTFEDAFGNTCTKSDLKLVLDTFFGLEQCHTDLSNEDDYFFFLEENNLTKGYMRINHLHQCPIPQIDPLKSIELVRLYVCKEYHGTGVAQSLMDYAIDFATSRGFEHLYLSVWEYNFRARGFYEKNGFKNTGIENDFPLGNTPQTDLWFVKNLCN